MYLGNDVLRLGISVVLVASLLGLLLRLLLVQQLDKKTPL